MNFTCVRNANFEHRKKERKNTSDEFSSFYITQLMSCTSCAARSTLIQSVPDPRAVCNFGAQGRSSAVPPADRLTSRGAQRCGWQASCGLLARSRGAAIAGYRGCLSAPCPRVGITIARPRDVELGTTGFQQKTTSAAAGCQCVAAASTQPQRGCVPCTSPPTAMSVTWSMNCWDFLPEAASSGGLCRTALCPSACHLLSVNGNSHVNASNK